MKLISRIRHGEPFKAALFAKVNEIVDYLLATRIVVGPGLRISETPNGLVLSITQRPTTGRSGAAGMEIISGGTYSYAGAFAVEMETGGTTCRVYNGALPASEHAGKLRLGTQVFSVPSEENIPAVIASGATSCTLYLMVNYSGGGYHTSYVTSIASPSDPQTWYTELAVLTAEGLHQMHLSGNIDISGRWFGTNHSLTHVYSSGSTVSAGEESGSSGSGSGESGSSSSGESGSSSSGESGSSSSGESGSSGSGSGGSGSSGSGESGSSGSGESGSSGSGSGGSGSSGSGSGESGSSGSGSGESGSSGSLNDLTWEEIIDEEETDEL